MKKQHQLTLGLGIVTITVLGAFLVRHYVIKQASSASVRVGTLSHRAEEFVASSSSQGTGLWSEVDLTENELELTTANQRLSTPCFKVTSPWPLIKVKLEVTDSRCVIRARVVDPPAYLTMTSYYHVDPAQDTGLQLRIKNPDTYQPLTLSPTLSLDVSGFTADKELTIFAWFDTTMFTAALTDVQRPTELPSADLITVLESLDLSPAPQPSAQASPASELDLPSPPML